MTTFAFKILNFVFKMLNFAFEVTGATWRRGVHLALPTVVAPFL